MWTANWFMGLNARQLQILAAIVEEYVASAEPVASKAIVDKYGLDVSSATVRNDMAVLDEAGLVRQPHTSAGRVPTETGYRVYLENFVHSNTPPKAHLPLSRAAATADEPHEQMRAIAKSLVELSGEAVVSSMDADWTYYTGLAKLFEKPEFNDVEMLRRVSGVVDRFDEAIEQAFEEADKDVNVWIGSQNPFGNEMATLLVRYRMPGGMTGILGLVGPLRMNYVRNIALLEEAKKLLDDQES